MKKYISNGFITFADILSVSRFLCIMYWALRHHCFLINISVRWSIYCSGLFDKSQFLSFTFPLVSTSPSRGNDKHLLDHLSFSKSLKHKENCSFHTRDWYLYGMFSVVWIWDEYWFWWRRDLKFLSDVITVQQWKVLLRNYPRIQLRALTLNHHTHVYD